MGRKAGVTAEQTRTELLEAAARVFGQKGYDGASIAEICSEAGMSTGPVYANFGSKAELFVAVLEEHGQRQYRELIGTGEIGSVADFLKAAGSTYDRRQPGEAALVIEAMVVSRRDDEVGQLVASWLEAGEALLAAAIKEAQKAGTFDSAVSPETISRFATMIGLGSFLTSSLDIHAVDHDDWLRLIERLIETVRTSD